MSYLWQNSEFGITSVNITSQAQLGGNPETSVDIERAYLFSIQRFPVGTYPVTTHVQVPFDTIAKANTLSEYETAGGMDYIYNKLLTYDSEYDESDPTELNVNITANAFVS